MPSVNSRRGRTGGGSEFSLLIYCFPGKNKSSLYEGVLFLSRPADLRSESTSTVTKGLISVLLVPRPNLQATAPSRPSPADCSADHKAWLRWKKKSVGEFRVAQKTQGITPHVSIIVPGPEPGKTASITSRANRADTVARPPPISIPTSTASRTSR